MNFRAKNDKSNILALFWNTKFVHFESQKFEYLVIKKANFCLVFDFQTLSGFSFQYNQLQEDCRFAQILSKEKEE